jgi:tRNA(Ile)-lysidine synthase
MLDKLQSFIQREELFASSDRILLACSGGMDSMALADLLREGDFSFALAHVNYQLRGEESDEDARFVKREADRLKVPFFQLTADTRNEMQPGESVQMAARRIRYLWLEEIRSGHGFDRIATAHQADDAIETFFLNFIRGSGLSGLAGIPVKRDAIVRPLLFATRSEIEAYARKEGIDWREDRSNAEDQYDRNKIRHHLMPLLVAWNPNFYERAQSNLRMLREMDCLASESLASWKSQCWRENDSGITIDLNPIRDHPARKSILFHWLKPLGFRPSQIDQALHHTRHAGALFSSPGFELLIDRDSWHIRSRQTELELLHSWPALENELRVEDGVFRKERVEVPDSLFQPDENTIFLDAEKVTFPLTLRHWWQGDGFQPLGMEGRSQKLQDFFTHQKLDRWEKERVWLMETARGEICWVVGYRLDHRFRISPQTRSCLKFSFHREAETE